jgi:biotin-[acetyl-CoA-carboxylase] ligase BirA-like protein
MDVADKIQKDSLVNEIPFAVVAKKQSMGRGSLGKSWQSPVGGLYITFVLSLGSNPIYLVCHRVAVIICEWIRFKFSLRCMIKWPNDIYFSGCKLGGILCESRIQGAKCQSLYVGLGINILKSSKLSSDNYKIISLQDILEKSFDVAKTADDLVGYFTSQWEDYEEKSFFKKYTNYSLTNKTLWLSLKDKKVFLQKELTEQGELKLLELNNRNISVNLLKTGQEYVLYYANTHESKPFFIALGVGNKIFVLCFEGCWDKAIKYCWVICTDNRSKSKSLNLLKSYINTVRSKFNLDFIPIYIVANENLCLLKDVLYSLRFIVFDLVTIYSKKITFADFIDRIFVRIFPNKSKLVFTKNLFYGLELLELWSNDKATIVGDFCLLEEGLFNKDLLLDNIDEKIFLRFALPMMFEEFKSIIIGRSFWRGEVYIN